MTLIAPAYVEKNLVRRDWVDLRDQEYIPNLSILRQAVSLDPRLLVKDGESKMKIPAFGTRNQGETGRCVGYALANLIDLQLGLQFLRGAGKSKKKTEQIRNIVSADMLYCMAFFHDTYPELDDRQLPQGEGVHTLRSVIKGFYHHGVCPDWPENSQPSHEHFWQSSSYCVPFVEKPFRFPSVDQAKKAREIGLGAYFRVAPILNHFHAALNDAEAILVSANVHHGWLNAGPENGGVIEWPPSKGVIGTHAFTLVGYDELGFHVLNSWGKNWGGYKGIGGVALWKYEDWARHIVDSWVLRLGVRAPTAFDLSIGEKGIRGMIGKVQTGSTPCFELMGHYIHLDDGMHVRTGSYPSDEKVWPKTRQYLSECLAGKKSKEKKYDGILIWISGSLEGIKPSFAAAARRKNMIKAARLYPYSVFWCNSFAENSLETLTGLFDIYKDQVGDDSEQLDALIENRIRGIGRAFWRDFKLSAYRAVWGEREHSCHHKTGSPPQGYIGQFLADLIRLRKETGCQIHLVAEAAGAQVVNEMLALLDTHEQLDGSDQKRVKSIPPQEIFDTLHLIHPSIDVEKAEKRLLPLIAAMNKGVSGQEKAKLPKEPATVFPLIKTNKAPRARIYIPTKELEQRVHFAYYGKSIQHLVSRSFAQRQPGLAESKPFLGMAELADKDDFPARTALHLLTGISAQKHAFDRVSQIALNNDTVIENHILETIGKFSDQKNFM